MQMDKPDLENWYKNSKTCRNKSNGGNTGIKLSRKSKYHFCKEKKK